MSKLDIIKLDINDAYKVVRENIYSCITKPVIVDDIEFHHNTSIENVPNALKYGLMSNRLRARIIENRKLTEMEEFRYADEHYVNGADHISLANMKEDISKKYEDESYWDSFRYVDPNIIINKDVTSFRRATNYFNEYLVQDKIPPEMFNSIDTKILKIIDYKFDIQAKNTLDNKVEILLKYYENLREIAIALKNYNLDIPLREISEVKNINEYDKAITLDKQKVIELPKLLLK